MKESNNGLEDREKNTKLKLRGLIIGKRCKSMHSRTTHTHTIWKWINIKLPIRGIDSR